MTYMDIENKVVSILGRYGAQTIGIFGSYARGTQRPDSDLDLLVNFKEPPYAGQDRAGAFGKHRHKIDLLTEGSVSPYLIDRIKFELKVIYQ